MDKFEVKLAEGQTELIVRTGEAEPIEKPESVKFEGFLPTPAKWMENKVKFKQIIPQLCRLEVFTALGAIKFFACEDLPHPHVLTGALKLAKVIENFGINTSKQYGDKELAKFIRQNSFYFADRIVCDKLQNQLMSFQGKVTTTMENMKDLKGNAKYAYEKVVQTDLTDSFVIKVPVYEGYPELEITVMLCAEADSSGIKFYLECADLFRLIEEQKKLFLDAEINKFEAFGCAIISK